VYRQTKYAIRKRHEAFAYKDYCDGVDEDFNSEQLMNDFFLGFSFGDKRWGNPQH